MDGNLVFASYYKHVDRIFLVRLNICPTYDTLYYTKWYIVPMHTPQPEPLYMLYKTEAQCINSTTHMHIHFKNSSEIQSLHHITPVSNRSII